MLLRLLAESRRSFRAEDTAAAAAGGAAEGGDDAGSAGSAGSAGEEEGAGESGGGMGGGAEGGIPLAQLLNGVGEGWPDHEWGRWGRGAAQADELGWTEAEAQARAPPDRAALRVALRFIVRRRCSR
jgi:hypothetical protein